MSVQPKWKKMLAAFANLNHCAFWGKVQPHFFSWEKCVFSHFSPGKKMKKKYMERERNEYFSSLSIHFFPMGKMGINGKRHIFQMGKNRVGPPFLSRADANLNWYYYNYISSKRVKLRTANLSGKTTHPV